MKMRIKGDGNKVTDVRIWLTDAERQPLLNLKILKKVEFETVDKIKVSFERSNEEV